MEGVPLEEVRELKLLGITFDNSGTATRHILSKAKTAGKLVGMLRRQSPFLSEAARFQIYVATIRPIIEYGCPVFVNAAQYALDALDKVQERAQRLFPDKKLDLLKLPRDVSDLCLLYSVISGSSPQPVIGWFKIKYKDPTFHPLG